MNLGWIKIHRKLEDNPIITKDNDYFRVWLHLLLNATHDEYSVLFNGERFTLKAGQLTIGRKKLANKLAINEHKIYRILNCFENEQMIEQVTDHKCTLITVLNWNKYQNDEQVNEQVLSKCRASVEQVLSTKQECKNDKNVRITHIYGEYKKVRLTADEYSKLITSYDKELTDNSIQYLDEYKERTGKKYKNDYLVIKKWVIEAVKKEKSNGRHDIRDNDKGHNECKQRAEYNNNIIQ